MITGLKYSQNGATKDQFHIQDGYDYSNSLNEEEVNNSGQTLPSKTPLAALKMIMVVDDCKDVNYTFKIVLSESDQRLGVHSFNDPLVALLEFRPGLYDLIIIDILMPRMNGFELYDKVRELDSNVKICFLTAASEIYYNEVIKEAFPELDTRCFISKPIAYGDLIKQVKVLLELK
ncbi:MAG: response regulator [Nitrososphaeraceae archaeon]